MLTWTKVLVDSMKRNEQIQYTQETKDLMTGCIRIIREKDMSGMSLSFWQPNRQTIVSKQRFRNRVSSIWDLYSLQLMASKVPVLIYIKRQINGGLKVRTFYGAGLEVAYIALLYPFGHTCEEGWEIESSCVFKKKGKGVWLLASSLCINGEARK